MKLHPMPNITQEKTAQWVEKVGLKKILMKDWEMLANPKEAHN